MTANRKLYAIAAAASIAALAGCGSIAAHHTTTAARPAAATSSPPAAPSTPPPPAPNAQGTITGSCDVSLSTALYGQNYLTAQVDVANTGNIGTRVRVRVTWPLQGFAPIVRVRTVRVRAGATRQAEFHVPVSEQQVSQFQDVQLAATGDPCRYRGTITSTWGQPQG